MQTKPFLSTSTIFPRSSHVALVAMLALSLGFGGCSKPQAPPAPPAMPVGVETLQNKSVADYSEFVATLISRNSVTLQAQVDGLITNIFVKPGDKVRKGTPLLMIDPAQQKAIVASSSATAQSLQANIKQAQDSLRVLQEQRQGLQSVMETSRTQAERYNTLLGQKSASQMEVDRYNNEYKQAQANLLANTAQMKAQQAAVNSAKAQFAQAQAVISQQRVQLQYYRVTAPFNGAIGDIPVKLGDYVEAKTTLLSVTDNSRLEINISVPSERLGQLRSGLPVQVVDENSGKLLAVAHISFVSPRIDQQSQTVLVKAIAENKDGILKADQVANVRIVWKDKPGIRVPVAAVTHMGGRDFVYVMIPASEMPKTPQALGSEQQQQAAAPKPADDGKPQLVAHQIPVTLSRVEGNDYIVESGLKPGDKLITTGIQKLGDGAPVQDMATMQRGGKKPDANEPADHE